MVHTPSFRVRFGDLNLDLRLRQLYGNGPPVQLPEQVFQLLQVLIEQDGELVTRDELRKRLWPNNTVVEFEHSINAAIKKLRKLLDDSAENSKYIETIPRLGYRLRVPVEWLGVKSPCDQEPLDGLASDASKSGTSGAFSSEPSTKAKLNIGRLTGKVLSHYRVLEVIGGGGQGMVYRAEDLRLGRAVALKFLPEEVADDPKARERFRREANAVSALDHTNICTVYDFDEHEGHPFIVMQLLQGRTLRDHLAEGRFRLTQPEGLEIAIQIAAGLEAAHAKGIIHRDVKPANIFITETNVAKILDFGVAKVMQLSGTHPERDSRGATPDLGSTGAAISGEEGDKEKNELEEPESKEASDLESASPDGTPTPGGDIALTVTGMKVGTAGYMSPEQVRGEPLDARSDIFSFGLVLYEMATGERPFTGETEAILYAAIATCKQKPARENNPDVTPQMEATLQKCLEKSPEQRFQSAEEIRLRLTALRPERRRSSPAKKGKLLIAFAAGVVVLTLSALIWWVRRPMADYVFNKYTMSRLTETDTVSLADISPDGKYVAFTDDEGGTQSLWLHQVATASTVRLYGPVSRLAPGVRFTPDGNYIYFSQSNPESGVGSLYRIPTVGGTPERIRPDVFNGVFYQVGFSPDGKKIVFARRTHTENSLIIANLDGTDERRLLTFGATEVVAMPVWSPSGKQIAFLTDEKAVGVFNCLAVVPVEGGKEHRVLRNIFSIFGVAWLPDESGLVIAAPSHHTQPEIWVVSYPKTTMRRISSDLAEYIGVGITSDGKRIVSVQKNISSSLWVARAGIPSEATHLREGSGRKDGMLGVAWLADGLIVYTSSEGELTNELWTTNRTGRDRKRLTNGPDADMQPSAASGKIVFDRVDSNSYVWDIWEISEDGRQSKRLTSSPATKLGPEISPDGTWITYAVTDGPYKMVLETGQVTKLAPSGEYPSISPDGNWIAFVSSNHENADVIEIVAANGSATPRFLPLPQEPQLPVDANLGSPPIRWTADGKAITYVCTKDGVSNIWAQPVDGSQPRQLTNFTSMYIWRHAWSPDGKYLVMARGNFSRDAVMLTDAR